MMSLVPLRAKGMYPNISFSQRHVLCILFCLFCVELNTQAAYNIDGTLRDWGVIPNHDWRPDSATANYIVTDNENTYEAHGYDRDIYDVEALYFDDDANFFYFAVVTQYFFAFIPAGGTPIPLTGQHSGGDLGLDFDISSGGRPNTHTGMNITEHGRVVMKGPLGNSTLGMDYGVRIGSSENGLLGQVITQPNWDRTQYFYYKNEGWQNGPWRIGNSPNESVIGLANITFGLEWGSYIIEGAIPRHIFSESINDGLVGLHITTFCGNDAANLVASYSGYPLPVREFFPLYLEKKIENTSGDDQQIPVVNPGELIDYLITYTSDRNTYPVTDVILTDTLPTEVTFVGLIRSDVEGVYNPSEHTYTCTYPSLLPSASGDVRLMVRVHDTVATDTIIANTATIDSYETEPTTTTAEAIVKPAILKPLIINKTIMAGGEDTDDSEFRLIDVGEAITYAICFTNPNNSMVTQVSLLDVLPSEMTFLSATGDSDVGYYDPNTHTYVCILSHLNAGESLCLELTAHVKPFTPAFTQVVNRVTIDSDQTEKTSAEVSAIVKPIIYYPLNTSKRVSAVNHEDVSVAIPLVEPGDLLTYEICFDNISNDHLVQNLTVVDRLPAEVIFVSDDSMESFGSYDPNTHSYTRHYPSLMPGVGTCFSLTVQVRDEVLPETFIRNEVTVDSYETDPNTATAHVLVKPQAQPLGFIKEIIVGGKTVPGEELRYINMDEEITYALCFINGNADRIVRNVTLVDTLPPEMVFVRATGDGDFGHYDPNTHTYIWTIPSLGPGEGQCLELTARVQLFTPAGTLIINQAVLDSDQTEPVEAKVGAIVSEMHFEPLNLSKRICAINQVNIVAVCPDVDPGNTLTYEIRFNNQANDYPIRELHLIDVLPSNVQFIEDLSEGSSGRYNPENHTYTWNTVSLPPDEEIYLKLSVLLQDEITPGTTVTNIATLSGQDIDQETAAAEALVRMPLEGIMECSPLILGRRGVNRTVNLSIVMELPPGILRNDIRSEPLILEPGSSAALSQEVFVENSKTKIRASFALTELFQAVPDNGLTQLTVRGRLQVGRGFFAQSSVLIVQNRPF